MIGIITFGKYSIWLNYGAVLHTWAFQQYLNSIDMKNEIIDYKMDELCDFNFEHPILSRKLKNRPLWLIREAPYEIKKRKFDEFYKKNMLFSDRSYSRDTVNLLDYDTYICESDVIWSSATIGGLDDIFLCNYQVFGNSLNISYAASTGDKKYSSEEEKLLKIGLDNFDYISVREKKSVDTIQKLTDKSVVAVLDPVFLIEKNRYEDLCKLYNNFSLHPNDYVVTYIIGNGNIVTKRAKEYAILHNKKIIEISTYPWNIVRNRVITTAGVEEFLWLIKNSYAVFTNTFHGTSFAIIFEKELFAFGSPNREGKIANILQLCRLTERYNYNSSFRNCPKIDYLKVRNTIRPSIEESKLFLAQALGIEKS